MKIGEAYLSVKEQLQTKYAAGEAETITGWALEHVTGYTKTQLRIKINERLSAAQTTALSNILSQLLQHNPIQYVLGEAWFYGLKFLVNESVLIPRPETEELVEWMIVELRIENYELRDNKKGERKENEVPYKRNPSILDIGTGSGCIPIALKKELPFALVTSIDVSEKALQIAAKNAEMNNTKIKFLLLDFLNEGNWEQLPMYDFIVSNPPYIPLKEKSGLDKQVTDWEPSLALFVADDDPLVFYRKIELFAKTHLNKGGKIFLEVHQDHAKKTKAMLEQHGLHTILKKDLNGNDRMLLGSYEL